MKVSGYGFGKRLRSVDAQLKRRDHVSRLALPTARAIDRLGDRTLEKMGKNDSMIK